MICGLKTEAQAVLSVVDVSKIEIAVSGANAERAAEHGRILCHNGAAAVISVGISGGLDPSLTPGDLVIGDRVIGDDGGRYESDRYLLGAIQKDIDARGLRTGAIFGSDDVIKTASKKAALFQNHETLAVDMESHGAARAAAENSVPFLAIRAIADPADRALPAAAINAIAPDGSTRMLATLGAAMLNPGQFPQLMKLGGDSAAALKTLRRDLGPLFRRLFLVFDL